MRTCNAYCTANRYRFAELKAFLEDQYKTVAFRDTLHIRRGQGEAFVFQFGVVVTWNLGYDESQGLLNELKNFGEEALAQPIADEFTYAEGENATRIHEDHIHLADSAEPVLQKLALSHGIAQSVKLVQFEEAVEKTIDSTRSIPKRIATIGSTQLSRRAIAKMRGELFLVKSYISLQFDLLDTPEFFWEYPEVEPFYQMAANYLDVKPRIEILDKKLGVIHELFGMLADEQKHKHSATLEWIIIWLIAIEIVIFIAHDFLQIY